MMGAMRERRNAFVFIHFPPFHASMKMVVFPPFHVSMKIVVFFYRLEIGVMMFDSGQLQHVVRTFHFPPFICVYENGGFFTAWKLE
jgi:hypothetical protein